MKNFFLRQPTRISSRSIGGVTSSMIISNYDRISLKSNLLKIWQ